MTHQINRRQKPIWQKLRKPMPPPTKPHSTKKGKKAYDRKDQTWKKEIEGSSKAGLAEVEREE